MEFDFKQCSIGELVELKQGLAINAKTKHLIVEQGLPLLRITDLLNNKVEQYIDSEKAPEKCIAKKGDLIYTRTGQVGHIFNNREGVIHNNCFNIKSISDEVLDIYIYWYFRQSSVKDYANGIASGSVQKDLNHSAFKSIPFSYPSLPEQQKIASILSAFDDKIELNNQINKNLEEMAQALFKSWFVDFEPFLDGEFEESELGIIPKGWKVAKLGDIVEQVKKSAKKVVDTKDKPYVPIDQIDSKKLALTSFKPWEEAQSSLIKFAKNDILFGAMRPYFHKVCISPFDGITRTTCFVLRPHNDFDLSFALMKIFDEKTVDFANSHSTGSTIPYAVWDNGLCNMSIIIPPENIREEFHSKVFPMIEKIRDSIFEINTLKQQRDTLLPKLMSGEVRV